MEPTIKKIRLACPYLVNPETKEAFGFYEVMVRWPDGMRKTFPSMEHAQAHIDERQLDESKLAQEVPQGFQEAQNKQPRIVPDTTDEAEPESDVCDVWLVAMGSEKIKLIKALRENIGLGLKECKSMVESVPIAVREGISKEEGEKLKAILTEAGGAVELK